MISLKRERTSFKPMRLILAITTMSLLGAGASASAAEGKTIMAIFAHPDDESTVAPILARYTREGATIHIIIATDGRYGTNEFSGLAAGDALAAKRRLEMQCAADRLGAELVHLRYHDQLRAAEGYDGHIPHVRALLNDVYKLIDALKPDVIITWGPDGGSNHIDHRLIGATVSNAYLSRQWQKRISLYFYGTPSYLIDNEDERVLRGVDEIYMNTAIAYEEQDLQVAYKALGCHESQFSPEMQANWLAARQKGDFKIYLREFAAPQAKSDSVFN